MADAGPSEDAPFHHYSRKQRAIAWISQNLFDSFTYTVRHGLLKGMKRKGGLGWLPASFSPGVSTAEHRFWSALDLAGLTVYDIGAFHGLLTLLFASRAKTVVAFEPNTQNRKRLMENLELNSVRNVMVRDTGIGSRRENRTMVASPLMPGFASVDEHAPRPAGAAVKEEIAIVTLDEAIADANLPAPDFIKIDIEGWELEALRGARATLERCRPSLFLEMHGETIAEKKRKVAGIVAYLWELQYGRILHIETETVITPDNSSLAMQGHLYCRS